MRKAFTLIELLVTISIMVLILVTALPAFRNYGYVNELDRASQDLSSAIVETQTLALASPTNKNKKHDSYKIKFSQDGYTIWSGIKSGDDLMQDGENQEVSVKSNNLPANVTIANLVQNGNKLIYSIADQGRISYPTNRAFELQLTHSKIDKTKNVTVNLVTGQVSIK